MSDQADGLRQMIQARSGTTAVAEMPSPSRTSEAPAAARSLVLTSGKGGVGTSNLALNLAIALGEYGQRVVLVDADLGLANIDLLCGLTPESDLGNVLAGDCSLADAVVTGPGDVRIVPGAHGTRTLVDALGDGPTRLVADLADLEAGSDFLLIDAGSGLGTGVATWAAAADQVVLVTTPEWVTSSTVLDALAHVQHDRTTLALNKSLLRAKDLPAVEQRFRAEHLHRSVTIPYDEQLAAMLDAGHYTVDALRRPTRLAIKRLGLAVAEQLV
jgi:MinD-like ATPase involved in chromosome partitioning or flagellar assembly